MNRVRNVLVLVTIISALVPASVCNAWWSMNQRGPTVPTHLQIGQAALDYISEEEYPDLKQMRSGIVGGIDDWMSGKNDDRNAHGYKYETEYQGDAGRFDGGPVDRWWANPDYPVDGVLAQYKAFNFDRRDYSAYYYLAMMAHLVGDQAVPAHAANIYHLQPLVDLLLDEDYGDNLENGADRTAPQAYTGPLLKIDETSTKYDPTYYYHNKTASKGSLDLTQSNLAQWRNPS